MRRVLAIAVVLGLAAPAAALPALVREVRVEERTGEAIPGQLRLTDSRGRTVRIGDYLGDGPVVLVLAYNRCTMLCSLVLRGVADAVRTSEREPGRDYRLVTVSIDPRDTPQDAAARRAALLETARRPSAAGAWAFLVGEEPVLRALADSLGFGYRYDARTGQYAHPAVIFVLSSTGIIQQYLYGIQYGDGILDRALAGAAAGEPSEADGGGVLSCFRFESALSRYWSGVTRFLEAGALLLMAGLGFAIAVFIRRERRR